MTKLVTAPMACGAVMVPTSMFMGQVVTAYNPFSGQQVRSLLPVCFEYWAALAKQLFISLIRPLSFVSLSLDPTEVIN